MAKHSLQSDLKNSAESPNRMFGHIEKNIRKHEVIILLNEYYETFPKHGTTKRFRIYTLLHLSLLYFRNI